MNFNFIEAYIEDIYIHLVGNKIADENCVFSREKIQLDEDLKSLLTHFFLSTFKSDEACCFTHHVDLNLNETYTYSTKIFEDSTNLYEQSKNLATHLYNKSTHPKIKGGEFYVVHFKNCILGDELLDVVGLFKSENKDTYLQVNKKRGEFEIESKQGINIKKLDKGCLIFNSNKEEGYFVSVIDNTNKGTDAQYWKNDFLAVKPLNNEYHQTNEFLNITKHFVTEQISQEFELTKAEQIDLLNKSVDYFKKHDTFDKEEFAENVFIEDDLKNSFKKFDNIYRTENEIELPDSFIISTQAVKKQSRVFKNVLKLDKNFHIYIHGDKELIERGIDENGRKYYKIFYEEEN